MTGANDLLLAFYGDDFTGSTDALEFLTRAGARSVLFIKPPSPELLARYPGLRAFGVAGMTRSMTPDAMEADLRPALASLRSMGVQHIHYKVCSTFDSSPTIGSIGRVIDVAVEIFRARFVPLLVGAPALGRHCVFGNLFARLGADGEIHRLDRHPSMSKHPITPADESDLRLHLSRQTKKRIGLFDILKVALPPTEAKAALETILAQGSEIVLFDVLYPEQLKNIGALIDAYASRERPLFSVGSSGIEMALGAYWTSTGRLNPASTWADPGISEPLLVASGSCSPVTEQQIARALSQGFAEVPLETTTLLNEKNGAPTKLAADLAAVELKKGRSVIIHTGRGGRPTTTRKTHSARILGSALGSAVRSALEQTKVRRVCIAGGDTSSYAARALGIEALEMMAPISPGAPLCRAHAPGSPADGLEFNFKGGQVGSVDHFETVLRGTP